jgi:hypothetical protein
MIIYALKDSESPLIYIINYLPDAIYLIDINGSMLTLDKTMEEMKGEKMLQRCSKKLMISIHRLFT